MCLFSSRLSSIPGVIRSSLIALAVSISACGEAADAPTGQGSFNTVWKEFPAHEAYRRKAFAASAKADAGAIAFFGDSITEQCPLMKLFPDAKTANLGIGGDTSRGMVSRMKEDLFPLKPKAVVLLCGVNDMVEPANTAEDTAANVRMIVDATLSSDAKVKIVVLNLMPTTRSGVKTVSEYNAAIDRALAGAPKDRCLRADVFSPMMKADGEIDLSCFRDGLHPNEKGYRIYGETLAPVIAKLAK